MVMITENRRGQGPDKKSGHGKARAHKGKRKGLSVGNEGAFNESKRSSKVGPLYQGILSDFLATLSPIQAETGMTVNCSSLNPAIFTSFVASSLTLL